MQLKINGEQPFQVLSTNFTIGPSESGYDLYFSADGISGYSKLFTVGANTNRQVTQVAAGSYYILSGNTDEVTVNWIKECGGQGGGGGSYVLPTASETTLGGVKIGSGITIDANGAISAEGGSYVLPTASESVLGGVKIGSGLTIDSGGTLSSEGGGVPVVTGSPYEATPDPGAVVSVVSNYQTLYSFNGINSDPYSVTLTDGDNVDYTFNMEGDFVRWNTYHEETNDWYIHYRWTAYNWDYESGRIIAGFQFYTTDGEGQAPTGWRVNGYEPDTVSGYLDSDIYRSNSVTESWEKVCPLVIFDLNERVDNGTLSDLVIDIYNGVYGDWDSIYLQYQDMERGETAKRLYNIRNLQGEIWFCSSDATASISSIALSQYYIPYNPDERYVHRYGTTDIGPQDLSMEYVLRLSANGSLSGDMSYMADTGYIYRLCVFTNDDPSNPDSEMVSLGTIKWWNKYRTEVDGNIQWYYTFAADVPVNNTIYSGVWGFYDNDHIETLSWTSGATYESQNYPPYNP